jgi:deazaflavin-dependent oxidoreductase (nitroreductase family)
VELLLSMLVSVNAVNDWNGRVIEEFRANRGSVATFGGRNLVLLHTTGAKTGAARVNPVVFLDLDEKRYVFASKAGADSHPDWYHNLVAHPAVTVEIGTESGIDTYQATAVPLEGAERDRIYAIQAERMPGFAEYQEKTTRVIPVVELRRA